MKIEINDFSYSYNKLENVLQNINVEIKSGDFVAIMGHNGSGKSTLIKSILSELTIPDNKIYIDGVDINTFNSWENIGYVPQKFTNFSFNYPLSVEELLLSSLNDSVKMEQVLKKIGIENYQKLNFNELSGGQQQRVFIARALLHDPDLLLLDEPFVGIDAESTKQILELLKQLNEDGKTILLVSHEIHSISKYAKNIIAINKSIFYYGPSKDYDDRMCDLC